MMAMYDYDRNTILVEPMKNKTTSKIVTKYKIRHNHFCRAGFKLFFQKVDNEAQNIYN